MDERCQLTLVGPVVAASARCRADLTADRRGRAPWHARLVRNRERALLDSNEGRDGVDIPVRTRLCTEGRVRTMVPAVDALPANSSRRGFKGRDAT